MHTISVTRHVMHAVTLLHLSPHHVDGTQRCERKQQTNKINKLNKLNVANNK